MAYFKFDLMAELGKLSQGKETVIPAVVIAKLAIDRIRDTERDEMIGELERLFDMPDTRV